MAQTIWCIAWIESFAVWPLPDSSLDMASVFFSLKYEFPDNGFIIYSNEFLQLLSDFESKISLDSVFTLSEKHLGKINEVSNHDSVIGWSLVIASILQSHRLSDVNEEILEKTFEVLYTLGLKKQYIELVMSQLMTEFVQVLTNKEVLVEKIILNRIKKDLSENENKIFFAFICLLILDKFPVIFKF